MRSGWREPFRRRERRAAAEVLMVLLVLALLAVPFLSGKEADAGSLVKKGSEVPRFELPLVGGGKLKLQEELGKVPLLLLYWSLYCDTCREDLPKIQKIYERLGSSRMKVMAINGDGKSAEKLVQSYWQEAHFTFLSLLDEETRETFVVESLLGVGKTPAAVVVDRKGVVQFAQEGRLDLKTLEESLEKAP
jgi:peroxiredoxin